jgi:plasmid stability protein
MKNITVAVPDEIYREARIRAAEEGSSVSALVGAYLSSLGDREAEFSRLEAQQEQALKEVNRFSAGDHLGRDEIHGRAVR